MCLNPHSKTNNHNNTILWSNLTALLLHMLLQHIHLWWCLCFDDSDDDEDDDDDDDANDDDDAHAAQLGWALGWAPRLAGPVRVGFY